MTNLSVAIYIKRAANLFDKQANRLLEEQDLTSTQFKFLKFLYHQSAHSVIQQDLEKHFDMTNPTVTRVLQKLEQKGFIIRKPHPKDARRKLVILTDKAYKGQPSIEEIGRRAERNFTKNLTAEESKQFIDLIQKIIGGNDADS